MKILKIFNNNSVAAINDSLQDIIVTGSGIGFQKKAGDLVDEEKVERIYILQENRNKEFIKLLQNFQKDYFEIAEMIIAYATKELNTEFDGSIFISIYDHITFAIKRKEQGIYLPNIVLNETKILYKKEYKVGLWALKCIEERTGVHLEEDEAGYLTQHFVNFSLNNLSNNATKIAALTKEVLEVIKVEMKTNIKMNSLAYARICTHLKYLMEKIFNKKDENTKDTTAEIRQMLEGDVCLASCVNKICKLIFERYHYQISPDEKTYLFIHIKRNI